MNFYIKKTRMEREIKLASEIQKKILPKEKPKIEGFEISDYFYLR